ncbi:DUF547 domain-containing protein [Rhodopirellula sp. SWK7]|uniref:DUF547 domain-containing protein n=1 Tax=Rhodopirellula sp. SWK7 TaxID=595460 RepID=UPI0002BFEE5C|nr:DUF547 domain-containing protein [Rhodopirellula sp. SWK7]EMI45642.1 secreted protein containing DUF547 [Rhodopirellula sp. SWK7]
MKSFHDRRIQLGILGAIAILGFASDIVAGNKIHLGRDVPLNEQRSMNQIEHGDWDRLLKRFVDVNGHVAYTAWKQSKRDMQTLDRYLAHLSHANPQLNARDEARLAFWINAYSAVTVRGILYEYPTTSIRNHTAKVFGYNIWKDLLLDVGGTAYSLNQIEHDVLRKMGEPRIHFAIVCASRSCPRLLNNAYTADQLETQLTLNTNVFFASGNHFRYDPTQRKFQLSSILNWFGEDFGPDQSARLRTIAPYLPSREAYDVATTDPASVAVTYLDYDWGLNDQAIHQ